MWIAISRKDEISSYWSEGEEKITVEVFEDLSDKLINTNKFRRVSQVFSLSKNDKENLLPDFKDDIFVRYCFFLQPMKVLLKLKKNMCEFDVKVFFGFGLCSVILMARKSEDIDNLLENLNLSYISYEEWFISQNELKRKKIEPFKNAHPKSVELKDYSSFSKPIKSIFEELHLLLNIFAAKVALIPRKNLFHINKIRVEVNSLITKIKKYQSKIDKNKITLNNINIDKIDNKELCLIREKTEKAIENINYNNQYVDRAIQLVSVLSYVSTQTFSGIIPILSRRSLLRRHSFLGIGSCVLALNNITYFIEDIFNKYNFTDRINKDFKRKNSYLPGIKNPHKYNTSKWKSFNIDTFSRNPKKTNNHFKLPYFSARYGFRESEYAVSAAIQSITNGADREWSIITLSHELMHSQVRKIINLILAGDISETNDNDKHQYYHTFRNISVDGFNENHSLLDSIRYVLFTHCCLSDKYGSLTSQGEKLVAGTETEIEYHIPKDFKTLFKLLMHNYRNINEIVTHLFDFYYIYRGLIEYYLMSIWHSWSSLPHINADIGQYVLRSLIIAGIDITTNDPHARFLDSASKVKSSLVLLNKEVDKPLITKIILLLNDTDNLSITYYGAFYSHLMLVDMFYKVFISENISAKLYEDENIKVYDDGILEELNFSYSFNDDIENFHVKSPIAFMLDRIQKINSKQEKEFSEDSCKLLLSII